jgi:hypothetical protein
VVKRQLLWPDVAFLYWRLKSYPARIPQSGFPRWFELHEHWADYRQFPENSTRT